MKDRAVREAKGDRCERGIWGLWRGMRLFLGISPWSSLRLAHEVALFGKGASSGFAYVGVVKNAAYPYRANPVSSSISLIYETCSPDCLWIGDKIFKHQCVVEHYPENCLADRRGTRLRAFDVPIQCCGANRPSQSIFDGVFNELLRSLSACRRAHCLSLDQSDGSRDDCFLIKRRKRRKRMNVSVWMSQGWDLSP